MCVMVYIGSDIPFEAAALTAGDRRLSLVPSMSTFALAATRRLHAMDVSVNGSCCCAFQRDQTWEFEEPDADEALTIQRQQRLVATLATWLTDKRRLSAITVAIVWNGDEHGAFLEIDAPSPDQLTDPRTFYDIPISAKRLHFSRTVAEAA
jgi:hypothetical protein